jgi:holo-[acyl-carrier protein] synthase
MIHGIGIDLVKIDRLREAAERWGKRFLERVYTEGELSYCYERKNPYLSLAVRFAAKEALIKAAGSGAPVSMRDIEVVNYCTGKPSIRVSGKLREFFSEKGILDAHVSLSHEREFGVACVVLERG